MYLQSSLVIYASSFRNAHLVDFSKLLHSLLLPQKVITALESVRIFSQFVQRDGYVAAPGGIALPDNFDGDFG